MRVTRIFVDMSLVPGAHVVVQDQAHHHLAKVLRAKAGERVVLFNGTGGEYESTLVRVERSACTALIEKHRHCNRESTLKATLLQGISRSEPMDYTLQKTVELGVTAIQPVFCERSAHVCSAQQVRTKMTHWQGVMIAACEQSGRTTIPELHKPLHLTDALAKHGEKTGIVLDLRAQQGLAELPTEVAQLALLVGPEGGFGEQELARAEQAGFERIRLGPRTLRSETAGVAALVLAQSIWGDLT